MSKTIGSDHNAPTKNANANEVASKEIAEQNLSDAQKAFRKLYEEGKLTGYDWIDNVEGGLDNKMFSFSYKDDTKTTIWGSAVADQDTKTLNGATVYKGGANTFSDALDTVAHEIKHLDPQNIQLWNSVSPKLMQLAQQQAINAGAMTVSAWNLCRECRL